MSKAVVLAFLASWFSFSAGAEMVHLAELVGEAEVKLDSPFDYPLNYTYKHFGRKGMSEWRQVELDAKWSFVGKLPGGLELWRAACPEFHMVDRPIRNYLRLLRGGEELAFTAPGAEGGADSYSIGFRQVSVSKKDSGGRAPPAGKFVFRYRALELRIEDWSRAKLSAEGKIGRGELLRRLVDIQSDRRDSLVVPGKSELVFRLPLDEGQRLSLSINLAPSCWRKPGDGVYFAVYLNGRDDKNRIFARYLDPKAEGGHKDWYEAEIDLAEHRGLLRSGKDDLFLVTEPGAPGGGVKDTLYDYACWGDVHLYRPARAARLPNVVVVFLDALRADRLGCYGYKRGTSPNIDALAAEATQFTRCYAPAPWTRPSFQAFFTGLYPSYCIGAGGEAVNSSCATLGEMMHEAGYYNVAFTGYANLKPEYGMARGFQRYYNHTDYDRHAHTLERAADYLARCRERPFFLFVHCLTPHSPYIAWPGFKEKFCDPDYRGRVDDTFWGVAKELEKEGERSDKLGDHEELTRQELKHVRDLYDCNVAYGDKRLGELVAKLKELGLYEDCLVIVTADHGEELWQHGWRHHGMHMYEHTIHVPLLVRYPSQKRGKHEARLVSLIDIMPSMLDYLGIPPRQGMQGRSWLGTARREHLFSEFSIKNNLSCVVGRRYKYIWNGVDESEEFYDLEKDRGEKKNIVAQGGETLDDYRRLLWNHSQASHPEYDLHVMFVKDKGKAASEYILRLQAQGSLHLLEKGKMARGDGEEISRPADGVIEIKIKQEGMTAFSFKTEPPGAKMKASLLVDGRPCPDLLFAGRETKPLKTLPLLFSRGEKGSRVDSLLAPLFKQDGVYIWRRAQRNLGGSGKVHLSEEEIRGLRALGYLH